MYTVYKYKIIAKSTKSLKFTKKAKNSTNFLTKNGINTTLVVRAISHDTVL